MDIDSTINIIQKACDEFINKNIDDILIQIKNNKSIINNNYNEVNISNIDKKTWGVYAFYIILQTNISTFKELNKLWKTNLKNKRLHSPAVIQNKFKPLMANYPTCIYVGKSEDLASRIKQHIHQETKYTTYGLKISEHDRLHLENSFEYSYFIIKNNPSDGIKDGMRCLLTTLERTLREKLNPLIGKQ